MADIIASAVRLPTPEPADALPTSTGKRKRSPDSRSPPRRHRSPPGRHSFERDIPLHSGRLKEVNRNRASERAHQQEVRPSKPEKKQLTAEEKTELAKKEFNELLTKRSGGVYVPPAKLRALQENIKDPKAKEFQRMAWDALKKSINGLINKVNVGNIKDIVPELFGENLIRGRGLFCRSIMKSQASYVELTDVLACTAAIVNTKLPQLGELLVHRLTWQYRRGYKRNDKTVCISSSRFLAALANQQVVHYMLVVQIILLLITKPTDDSIEIACSTYRTIGMLLDERDKVVSNAIMDSLRQSLHENKELTVRTQYTIESVFMHRREGFKQHPTIREELDIIEEEDQITHQLELDDEVNTQDNLNVFKYDPEWEENEKAYARLRDEILGNVEGSDEEDMADDESEESEEDEETKRIEIKDQSNMDLVNLRKTIYLNIKGSGGFEEAVHKLMRVDLPPGKEKELPQMIIEGASQERTYNKFYGLIAERFAKLNRLWKNLFEELFTEYYETIHRLQTNRIRIVAQMFGHLLATDAIAWNVLEIIHLNEEETSSSSRIFIKILFEDLVSALGMKSLAERLKEPELQPSLEGLFPKDNPKNTRFAINFFTACSMGLLTEGMREYLKTLPKPVAPALPANEESESESESESSFSSRRSRSMSGTPPRRTADRGERGRRNSYSDSEDSYDSRSRSPPRRRYRSRTRSPDRRRRNSYSSSDSRSRTPSRTRANGRGGDRTRRTSSSPPPPRRTRRSPSIRESRSRSPIPRRSRRSPSIRESRSRSPIPRRSRRSPSTDKSHSRSRSRSRSLPPRRRSYRSESSDRGKRRRGRSETPPRRNAGFRRNSSSVESTRGERRRDRYSPPARRRRYSSDASDDSRGPPRRDGRR
jgi:pre-mRNA-splicing factor CWC22